MTRKPPARLSRPPTPPGSPAPAHGDGPTGPSAPTGRTEPRGCPFGFRHYNCDCKPLEATMPEPADPLSGDLRERLAKALTAEMYQRAHARIEAPPERHCEALAAAALPVVEAECKRAIEAVRADIVKGVRDYFSSVDDGLWDDVQILCGRIERGEYGVRGESR